MSVDHRVNVSVIYLTTHITQLYLSTGIKNQFLILGKFATVDRARVILYDKGQNVSTHSSYPSLKCRRMENVTLPSGKKIPFCITSKSMNDNCRALKNLPSTIYIYVYFVSPLNSLDLGFNWRITRYVFQYCFNLQMFILS